MDKLPLCLQIITQQIITQMTEALISAIYNMFDSCREDFRIHSFLPQVLLIYECQCVCNCSLGILSLLDNTMTTWSTTHCKYNHSPQVLTNNSGGGVDDDDDKNVVVVVAPISFKVFVELCIKRMHTYSQGKTSHCDV